LSTGPEKIWRAVVRMPHRRAVPKDYPGLGAARRTASRQDGAITHAQALDAGLTPGQIRQLVRDGRWSRPFHGTHLLPGAHPVRGRIRAALLTHPGSVVCGLTAARLHRLDALPAESPGEPVHLLMPPGAPHSRATSIVAHRDHFRGDQVVRMWGMPVTSPARTLADLVLATRRDDAVALLDAALYARAVVDVAEVQAATLGRLRSRQVEPWWPLIDGRAESPLETRLRLLLIDAGLAPEDLQHPVRMDGRIFARLDLAWPSRRVCLEADGGEVHSRPDALYRDRHRQNLLVAQGWTVLRATWRDLFYNGGDVIGMVAGALAFPRPPDRRRHRA
jgi:very-short-patch-repair endonuclease